MHIRETDYDKRQKQSLLETRKKILGLGERSLRKNYYPELQDRKEKLESLLRSAPIGIGIVTNDIITEINKGFCNMMGYTEGEIIGKNINIFFASHEEFEYTRDKCLQAIREKNICSIETKWETKYGKLLTIMLSFSPLDPQDFSKGITFTANNITDRKEAEEILFFEKERLRITLQSIGDGVIATDRGGKVVLINPLAEKLTGWSQEEGAGKQLKEIFKVVSGKGLPSKDYIPSSQLDLGLDMDINKYMILSSRDGQERKISHTASPIKDQQGETKGVVLVFRDITKEIKRQEEIIRLSYYDSLTGLHNRIYFEKAISKLDREEYLPLSIVMGDINGLKLTNDVFGHHEGDKLLQLVAKIMKDACRPQDIIARWGGDEFVILLPQTSHRETGLLVEKILKACKKYEKVKIKPSISLGYTSKINPHESIMELLKDAEDMMYQHKLIEGHSLRRSIFNSIKETLDIQDYQEGQHSTRLKDICQRLGKALKLSEVELHKLELLSVLHDIGRVVIEDSILNNNEKPSQDMKDDIKRHPEVGYRIVQSIPELSHVAEYILSQYERWDGKGYPRGLKGKEIPFLSRILAVATAYDIISSENTGKKVSSKDMAIAAIMQKSGTQFDPNIVKIFMDKIVGNI